jgi:hypothetical protein
LLTRNGEWSFTCGVEGPGVVNHNSWVDQVAELEGYANASCEVIEGCNESELLDDLRKESVSTSQYFCLNPGSGTGMNCQEWATSKIKEHCGKCK